jgi:hypothetical protein
MVEQQEAKAKGAALREAGKLLKDALEELRGHLKLLPDLVARVDALERTVRDLAPIAAAQHTTGNLVTVHDARLRELQGDLEAIAAHVGLELGMQGGGSSGIDDAAEETLDREILRDRRGL